jgi:hypothetical protein
MKVFEVFHKDLASISEEEMISKLKTFNWNYEYQPNIKKSLKELELLENFIYQMWKKNPERAIKIWNENTPFASSDKSVVPSFIFRLQAQDAWGANK